jgi:hypothetical protein
MREKTSNPLRSNGRPAWDVLRREAGLAPLRPLKTTSSTGRPRGRPRKQPGAAPIILTRPGSSPENRLGSPLNGHDALPATRLRGPKETPLERLPRRSLGPFSRQPFTLATVDENSPEGQMLRRVRDALTEHVGGRPNLVQQMLIDRAAMLMLRLALFDQKIVDNVPLAHTSDQYLMSWQNALTRTLIALGVNREAARHGPLTLDEVMREVSP